MLERPKSSKKIIKKIMKQRESEKKRACMVVTASGTRYIFFSVFGV